MARQAPDPHGQLWDPLGTLRNALWIGGGQWAGKSSAARILALRYGLTAYHYDYHDARGHDDRRIATASGTANPRSARTPNRPGYIRPLSRWPPIR